MVATNSVSLAPAGERSGWHTALLILQQALGQAAERRRDTWQFAVELEELRLAGVSVSDLRALLCQGLVEHAEERSGSTDDARIFLPLHNLSMPAGACFVLTNAGQDFLRRCRILPSRVESKRPLFSRRVPRWDAERRELWLGGLLVKRFRVQAVNQERVLSALEEEGWPKRIDDPLYPEPDQDPAIRLRDTIKGLNRKQINPLLTFHGDGTGRAVLWQYLPRKDRLLPATKD